MASQQQGARDSPFQGGAGDGHDPPGSSNNILSKGVELCRENPQLLFCPHITAPTETPPPGASTDESAVTQPPEATVAPNTQNSPATTLPDQQAPGEAPSEQDSTPLDSSSSNLKTKLSPSTAQDLGSSGTFITTLGIPVPRPTSFDMSISSPAGSSQSATDSGASPTSSLSGSASSSHTHRNVGAIVGGVVGALVLFTLATFILVYIKRRRHSNNRSSDGVEDPLFSHLKSTEKSPLPDLDDGSVLARNVPCTSMTPPPLAYPSANNPFFTAQETEESRREKISSQLAHLQQTNTLNDNSMIYQTSGSTSQYKHGQMMPIYEDERQHSACSSTTKVSPPHRSAVSLLGSESYSSELEYVDSSTEGTLDDNHL